MVNGLLTSLVLINLSPLLRHPYQFSSMKIHLVTALVIILSKVRTKIFLNYQLKKKKTKKKTKKKKKKKTKKKKKKLPQSNQYINTKDNLPKKEVI